MKELREIYVLTPNLVEIIYTPLIRSFYHSHSHSHSHFLILFKHLQGLVMF